MEPQPAAVRPTAVFCFGLLSKRPATGFAQLSHQVRICTAVPAGESLMRIETITRKGKEFAVIPVKHLQKLLDDAEMLADVRAYDAAKARLADGKDELVPLEITERRLRGEPPLRIWREYRQLTQEQVAKKSKVSRALIAAIETNRKAGSVSTWKKLGAALDVSWEQLA
jgi:DNA-binding XRE family transcriptional regulator